MATRKGTKAGIPDQYDKFDEMNACAEAWRNEAVKIDEDDKKTSVKTQRMLLRLYNECLKYVNNGINKDRTIVSDIPEEEWKKLERYDEQIKAFENELKDISIKLKNVSRETGKKALLKTKKDIAARKAELEIKKYEIEEWKEFAETQKLQEALLIKKASFAERVKNETDAEEKKKLKKNLRAIEKELLANTRKIQTVKKRWEEKENQILEQETDNKEAWLSVLGEAFTQALNKYKQAIGKPTQEKPFSLWLIEQIPNAKERVGIIGSLLVDPEDAYYETISYTAKQYLKTVCKLRKVKNFEMPRHVYTIGFLETQLEKLGLSAEEAKAQAGEALSDRNIRLDIISDSEDGTVQNRIENYLYDRRQEKKAAKVKYQQLLLQVYEAVTCDTKLSSLLFPYIRYYLTAQLFEEGLAGKRVYKHIIHPAFYQLLDREEIEAKTKNRKPTKPHVLLANMLKLESETVRKNFNKAQKKLIDYFNEVLKKNNEIPDEYLP